MKTKNLILLAAAMLAGTSGARAATTFTVEHVDIGLAEDDVLSLHWHDETNAAEYEPDEARAFVDPSAAAVMRPAGAAWDFTGVSAGATYYEIPENSNPLLPFLGIGAEDADPSAFDVWNPGDARGADVAELWFGLRLLGVSYTGPAASAEFSLWRDDGAGNPVVWMTSSDGIGADDVAYVLDHGHFNFSFSELGIYDVTFESFAVQGGLPVTSAPGTYQFVVPEPGVAALGLLAGAGAMARRRRLG